MAPSLLWGSAICDDAKWVACPSCQPNNTNLILKELWSASRIVPVISSSTDETLYFARKNTCGDNDEKFPFYQVIISSISCIFFAVSFYRLAQYQHFLSVKFDERNATSTDFSIEIKNPPKDAIDPEEWKTFLQSVAHQQISTNPYSLGVEKAEPTYLNTHVTCITIAIDNNRLIDALIQRRLLKKAAIENMDSSTHKTFGDYYNDALLMRENNKLNIYIPKILHKTLNQYAELNKTIEILITKKYNASRVFATFETEIGQRAVLTALSASKISTSFNKQSAKNKNNFLFRGKNLLNAHEPMEPLTVYWNNLGISRAVSLFFTFILMQLTQYLSFPSTKTNFYTEKNVYSIFNCYF